MNLRILRLGPIITPEMIPGTDGENINGPSLIKVPGWVSNPLGAYYLYFAHHNGKYIRLAYADDPAGPYRVYPPGTLALADCPALRGHIASPDVHVDTANKSIRMYFHGPSVVSGRRQKSFVAEGSDGINFKPSSEVLGIFYFRAWQYGGFWYALGKGRLYRSVNGLTGFTEGHLVYGPGGDHDLNQPGNIRHAAVDPIGDTLFVYFTIQADAPEQILQGQIDMTQPWTDWKITNVVPVLKPEMDYEGALLPIGASKPGAAVGDARHELRDPGIYNESSKKFMLYAIAGEKGIAVAQII